MCVHVYVIICNHLFIGMEIFLAHQTDTLFHHLLWHYDTDMLWYQKLGPTWRDMSKGSIQYDKEMTCSGAAMKDADVSTVFT